MPKFIILFSNSFLWPSQFCALQNTFPFLCKFQLPHPGLSDPPFGTKSWLRLRFSFQIKVFFYYPFINQLYPHFLRLHHERQQETSAQQPVKQKANQNKKKVGPCPRSAESKMCGNCTTLYFNCASGYVNKCMSGIGSDEPRVQQRLKNSGFDAMRTFEIRISCNKKKIHIKK